jgi:hypothetical protein
MDRQDETPARAFRRTSRGDAALRDSKSGLSPAYRRILEQIDAAEGLRPLLQSYPRSQIVDWLSQLITLGMVESASQSQPDHLSFTGRFKVSELTAAFKDR